MVDRKICNILQASSPHSQTDHPIMLPGFFKFTGNILSEHMAILHVLIQGRSKSFNEAQLCKNVCVSSNQPLKQPFPCSSCLVADLILVCCQAPNSFSPALFCVCVTPKLSKRNGGCAHSRPPGQIYIVFTKTTSGFGQKWLSALFGATFLDPDVSYTGSCPETKPQGSRVPENDNLTKQKRMELIKHLTKSNATKNRISNKLPFCLQLPWISSGTAVSALLI